MRRKVLFILVKTEKTTVESAIDIGISAKIIVGKSYNFENILPIGIQLFSYRSRNVVRQLTKQIVVAVVRCADVKVDLHDALLQR